MITADVAAPFKSDSPVASRACFSSSDLMAKDIASKSPEINIIQDSIAYHPAS